MQSHSLRHGFSLLELITATAMMAVVVTSAVAILRSAQTTWTVHASDQSRLDAGYATLRHITRGLRQAQSVTAISASSDLSGSITAVLASGDTVVWDHSGTQVNYGISSPTSLLASGVSELSFVGYKADGVTTTTAPGEVQAVLCTAKVSLQQSASPTRTISTRIWLRAW